LKKPHINHIYTYASPNGIMKTELYLIFQLLV